MSTPSFRPPMLATLVGEPVEGDEWIFERKLDGIRMMVVRDGDELRMFTRNGLDRSGRYPDLHESLARQPHDRFVVDGEVVAFDGDRTSFARLQARSGLSDPDEISATGIAVVLYLFDVVHLDGEDRAEFPLRSRKTLLHDEFVFDGRVRFCSHRERDGAAFLEQACSDGWEGLIAKRADSAYRSGRSRDWLKLKCVARQEFVIGGFTEPAGSRTRFGALLVGHHRNGELIYAGRVGTGFDRETLDRLGDRLAERERDHSPFADAPRRRGVHWVRPDLVCEVGFTEWTGDGRLRHPRYLGLRDDKPAETVVRETPEIRP